MRKTASNVIYAIGLETGGPLKIGRADNLASRLSALQVSSSEPMKVWGSMEVARFYVREAESLAHAELAAHRVRGEWFDVPLDRAMQAIGNGIAQATPEVSVVSEVAQVSNEVIEPSTPTGDRRHRTGYVPREIKQPRERARSVHPYRLLTRALDPAFAHLPLAVSHELAARIDLFARELRMTRDEAAIYFLSLGIVRHRNERS